MIEKKDFNVRIGANIQSARELSGYTQEQFSELINVTPKHLSAIERGVSGISIEKLCKICHLLGVSADYIIFGASDNYIDSDLTRKFNSLDNKYKKQVNKMLSILIDLITR